MANFIFQMPVIYLFLFVSTIFIFFSIFAVFLVRRFIPYRLRRRDDAVIGNIGALISIIYGVLVG